MDAIANYVYKKCQYPEDLTFFDTYYRTEIEMPKDPLDKAICTKIAIWEVKMKKHVRRKAIWKSNEALIYNSLSLYPI